MKQRLYIILYFLLLSPCFVAAQQAFSYTQYMSNLTPLNPAYSLIEEDGSVNMLVRKQWASVDGAPTSYIFNANMPIQPIGASAGLIALSDKIGVENQTQFNAFFAKSIRLAENQFLGVSLLAGVRRFTADYTQLDPGDPLATTDIRETKMTTGVGVMYYSNNYYLGIAVPQLSLKNAGNNPSANNRYFRNTWYFSGGSLADISDDVKLKPVTLVSYTRGVPLIADISALFLFKDKFDAGMNYRTNNELAAIVFFNIDNLHIGYSYQFGASSSNLGGINNATHEISLGFHFSRANAHTADSERQLGL